MTDIKRVLAYSTVSQLGYMMLALGVGGWVAGLFHLLTHAFFKALLFLGAGSVIHACGTNDMTQMGGLLRKMPWTAWTMLVGCLAISGAGVPMFVGLSGYYSKDAIMAQLFLFRQAVPDHGWLWGAAAVGAALTPAYMFRLWYLTFAGSPRDPQRFAHAHESPPVMVVPLVVLAGLAVVAGWRVPIVGWSLTGILEQARPLGTSEGITGAVWLPGLAVPAEHLSHAAAFHAPATWTAFSMSAAGFLAAMLFYGLRLVDPGSAARCLAPLYALLRNKWWFDELYQAVWVRPVLALSRAAAAVDRQAIDWLADHLAQGTCALAKLDDFLDRRYVDGALDLAAQGTYRFGLQLRAVQTGRLRHYVLWLAAGTVALFVLVSWYRVYAG